VAWDTDLVTMTRVIVNDLHEPQKHDDYYLRRVLVCAGILVRKDIELPCDYRFDVGNVAMTPDPVANGDSTAQALLPLKAACMLNQGAYITAIGQGIRVRDGDSQIDTTVGFKGFRDILELGPCASYLRLLWHLQATSCPGGAVLGPHRGINDGAYDSIVFFYDSFAQSLSLPTRRFRG
jgi:hypothetical protein